MVRELFTNPSYWFSEIMFLKGGIDFLVGFAVCTLFWIAMKNRVTDAVLDSANRWIFYILMALVGLGLLVFLGFQSWKMVGLVVLALVLAGTGVVLFFDHRIQNEKKTIGR